MAKVTSCCKQYNTPYSGIGSAYTFLEVRSLTIAVFQKLIPLTSVTINLVNSSTPYVYDPRTQTYGQPAFAQQLLKRFVDVNEALIKDMKVQGSYPFEERAINSASSLVDLISVGLEFQHQAPSVLNALMTELSQQTKYAPYPVTISCLTY